MQAGKPITFTDGLPANRKIENLSVIGKHTDDDQLQLDGPVQITGALNVSTINTPGSLLLQTSGSTRLNIDGSGNASFGGNLTIQGDVSIEGTTTTVNATQVDIGDNIILLNAGADSASSATLNAGFEINRGSDGNVSFLWDETIDRWSVGANDIQASEFYENGTALSSKYLGIGAMAADSDRLDGHDSSYFAVAADTYTKSETYTKAEVDAEILAVDVSADIATANTAMTAYVDNKVNTLEASVYTKGEVDTNIGNANTAMKTYVDNAVASVTITGLSRDDTSSPGNTIWTFA